MNIGGQALVEGVMMRGPTHYSMAVRTPSKKIETKVVHKESPAHRYKKLIFIRGLLVLVDTLIIGLKALMWSGEKSSDEKITKKESFFTILISLAATILFFILIPLWISKLVTSSTLAFNIVDGLLRVLVFVVYVLIIARMKDVKRTFQYHGAEHMTIACFEDKKALTLKNIKKYSPIHERCGTAFIFIVLILSIIIFSFITSNVFYIKFLSRIVLIPVIAGISYEILKFSARHPKFFIFKIFVIPGLWFQKITTAYPHNDQIEVAVASLKALLKKEKA
ncbi:MAG TPA: DUF1385 domain-containing protein [Candidatus Nanoarchaeia archaeon]|nr:DUF1385 domain-containing protein [Candidatus Nanoarchaeia archaeon]